MSKPYTHTVTHSRLALAALDDDQHGRTCGYWYAVTSAGTPHTAFRTREALTAWLDLVGVELSADLPPHGSHGYQSLIGSYATALTMDVDAFWKVEGKRVLSLSNGQYTIGIVQVERDSGSRTIWTLNPNVERPTFPHIASAAQIDRGEYRVPFAPDLVGIERKRFSVTQGEVLITYAGQRIEQYGDDIRLSAGEWTGLSDASWREVAERETFARGLAV